MSPLPVFGEPSAAKRWLPIFVGLLAVAGLVTWQGAGAVANGLVELGWGLALLPLATLPNLGLAAASWRSLFDRAGAPTFFTLVRATWIGNSAGTLLPITSLGGEAVRARIAILAGADNSDVAAAAVVGQTAQALSLAMWAMVGIAALIVLKAEPALISGLVIGVAALGLGVAGFMAFQRAGMFEIVARVVALMCRSPRYGASGQRGPAKTFDSAVRALYQRPGRIISATALHFVARVALTFEVWIVAHLMGLQLSLAEALMIKSLTGTLRGVAFFVPGGFGVQEAGFVGLAVLFGLPVETMLAISLATRGREFLLGAPGLLAWHHIERSQARTAR